eukprot:symbB.v1.2.032385.t1/scaffold3856.1/size95938/3
MTDQSTLKALRNKLSDLEDELDTAHETQADLEKQLNELKITVEEKDEKLQLALAEAKEASERCASSEAQLQKLQETSREEQSTTKEPDAGSLTENNTEESERLKSELQEWKASSEACQMEKQKLEEELKMLRQQREEAEKHQKDMTQALTSEKQKAEGAMLGAEDDKSFNRVPIWNGKPEDFSHYVQEIRWFFAATKSADRPYAAARLIRRMLDSEYTALKTLMYKLDPSDFRDEDGIGKLIAFLENSPMNRQPIPDAGAKLSQYYRKLGRKSGESIPQFLVREDHAHDGMWRALQRLLREKALDFSKYDVSETELRIFCGMGDQSYYYETEMNAEEEELDEDDQASRHSGTTVNPNRSGKGSSSTSTRPGPEPKRKDLIERLMDKGLIPIAALDIIRGWMILEMTSSTDTDKALVKAATQNKLGYEAIRAALLSMHEDRDRFPRHGDKGRGRHHALHWSEDWQQSYDMQEMTIEQEDNPESSAMLAQLEEESHGLQAMLAENQRNLQQARQAVASAKKDRGWQHPTAQSGGKYKPTSTFMKGKGGKAKGKNFSSPSSPNSPIMWTSKGGQKGQFRRPSFSQKGFQGGKSAHKNWYNEMYESGMLTLEMDPGDYDMNMHEVDGLKPAESDQVFQMQQTKSSMRKTPSLAVSSNSSSQGSRPRSLEAGGTKGVIDTGATVSAGGRSAVQEMVTGLAKVRPDLEVTIMQGDRPYFRYGSGQWGRALIETEEGEYQKQEFELFGFEPIGQSWDEERCCQHLGISGEMWTFIASPSAQRFKSFPQDPAESCRPQSSQVIHGSQFGDQGHAEGRYQRGARGTEVRSHSFRGEQWVPLDSNSQVKVQDSQPEEDRVRRIQEDDTHIRFRSPYVGDSVAMPRCSSDHVYGNNRYGRWGDCLAGGTRTEDTPAAGCPANGCKFDHGPNVIEALERLRSSGWTKDNLEPTTVKHMIKLVSSEKVVTKPKSKSGTSTKKNKPVEEVQVALDDSFELTEDKDKIQAKMNAKAKAMVKRIVQIWKKEWHHDRQSDIIKNAFTIHSQDTFQNHWNSECEQFSTQNDLMPVQEEQHQPDFEDILQDKKPKQGPENLYDYEVPPDTRERARIMLHKLHCAAGHPTNRNLAKLCRDRQLPKWIVKEALELKCQACKDTERGQQLIQHRSLGDRAVPWQTIAMDGFELHFPVQNVKALIGTMKRTIRRAVDCGQRKHLKQEPY